LVGKPEVIVWGPFVEWSTLWQATCIEESGRFSGLLQRVPKLRKWIPESLAELSKVSGTVSAFRHLFQLAVLLV